MTISNIIWLLLVFSIFSNLEGRTIFDLTTPDRFVNDYAELLTYEQELKLESKVRKYESHNTIQIAVVTVKSLDGLNPALYSYLLAEQWGIGYKGKDNGILILIKPKYINEKGEVFISVGKGLEKIITDENAKEIIDEVLIPNFKNESFYIGLNKGIDSIIKLYSRKRTDLSINDFLLIIFSVVLSLITILVLYLVFLKNRKIKVKYSHFYIKGEYNTENLLNQLEIIENVYNKKYKKFRRLISKYKSSSKNNLIKYSKNIDQYLFCFLLNGRKRRSLFWEMSDKFLLFIGLYLFSILFTACLFLYYYFGITALLYGIVLSISSFYFFSLFMISLLEVYQLFLRKNANNVGGVSIAIFALNCLFKRKIKKKYISKTNSYMYYPHTVHHLGISSYGTYSENYNNGSVGGSSGGGGLSGFGGGSFGGGGAGGSW